jgi:hypothetical protein
MPITMKCVKSEKLLDHVQQLGVSLSSVQIVPYRFVPHPQLSNRSDVVTEYLVISEVTR